MGKYIPKSSVQSDIYHPRGQQGIDKGDCMGAMAGSLVCLFYWLLVDAGMDCALTVETIF